MLINVRNVVVITCLLEDYEEIGEGCESKKCEFAIMRVRARMRGS